MTKLTKTRVTRKIVFCVSPDLDKYLREMAWQRRKLLSQLVRELCESGLVRMKSA